MALVLHPLATLSRVHCTRPQPVSKAYAGPLPCVELHSAGVGGTSSTRSSHRRQPRVLCHSASSSSGQQDTTGGPVVSTRPQGSSGQQQDVSIWDLDWWHYTPFWYKPHYVIIAGLSFIVGCNLGTVPSLKTTLIAAAPVAVGWYIFLWMVPKQFTEYAKQYIKTHPECEAKARAKQQAQAQEDMMQQQASTSSNGSRE